MSEVIKILSHRIELAKNQTFAWEWISIGLMWLFTVSALIGIFNGQVAWFIPKTPINLLLCFLLLLINVPIGQKKGKLAFFLFFIVGMSVEIYGVATGSLFGTYYYGDNLGFKAWGVPIMIGIYWAVLVSATSQIARLFSNHIIGVAIIGAGLMVGQDFIMEHLASVFDFWHFEGGLAGIQNYIAWFFIAFILHLIAYKWMDSGGARFSFHLLVNQVLFFSLSYMILF